MSVESGTIDILIVAADVNSLAAELEGLRDIGELAKTVGELASQSDLRAKVLPLRFPATLSLGLLPVFTRAVLYDAELPTSSTAFVNILASDGRILDLGVPRDLVAVAPHLFQASEDGVSGDQQGVVEETVEA